MKMSAEKTSDDSTCTEHDLQNKNKQHYRYYNLFLIIEIYKYLVCSF